MRKPIFMLSDLMTRLKTGQLSDKYVINQTCQCNMQHIFKVVKMIFLDKKKDIFSYFCSKH